VPLTNGHTYLVILNGVMTNVTIVTVGRRVIMVEVGYGRGLLSISPLSSLLKSRE
jgi:hypothetical protein